VTAQWLDPGAGLQVVTQSSLPSWIAAFHIIEAVTTPAATESQLSSVVNPFLGQGNSAFTDNSIPGSGQTTYDITIMGSAATVQNVVQALTASGLFTSIIVKI
jgi:hypothetical protein